MAVYINKITIPVGMTSKKKRLIKESELVPSRKGTPSSLPPRKSSTDKASKGQEIESSSERASSNLSTALILNESRLHFQLNPNSTSTSIANMLSNNVFGSSLNLTDPRIVSTICHIVQSTEQLALFTIRTEGDLFGAFKRQVLIVSFSYSFSCFEIFSYLLTYLLAL